MSDVNSYMKALYNHYADLLDEAIPANITPTVAPQAPEESSSSKRQSHSSYPDYLFDLNVWDRVQPFYTEQLLGKSLMAGEVDGGLRSYLSRLEARAILGGGKKGRTGVGVWYRSSVRAGMVGLDEVVRSVPSSKKIIIAGDFNGHIEVLSEGYEDMHGDFCFSDKNGEEAALLHFVRTFGLVVVDSSFPKKKDHLITFRNVIDKTQIDFLLLRKEDWVLCKDFKVISSEHLLTQHRLLVLDLSINKSKKRRVEEGRSRIK
ncbi:uncharacterized protein LOC107852752 [Capsicum annuum]|uniref:uncharacterized protein LOC107852752 n=1 Tax=Capsicum annuum TaxID=4072 RepID=UPI0007BEB917|nr:uncharacterized protein LOC107852752 [Capsicum annuum]